MEVPAIWREVSKQFMREEVLRAGFACNYCGLNNTSSDICIDDSSFATYSCKSQRNVLSVWTFEGFGICFRFCEVTSHQLALRRWWAIKWYVVECFCTALLTFAWWLGIVQLDYTNPVLDAMFKSMREAWASGKHYNFPKWSQSWPAHLCLRCWLLRTFA